MNFKPKIENSFQFQLRGARALDLNFHRKLLNDPRYFRGVDNFWEQNSFHEVDAIERLSRDKRRKFVKNSPYKNMRWNSPLQFKFILLPLPHTLFMSLERVVGRPESYQVSTSETTAIYVSLL